LERGFIEADLPDDVIGDVFQLGPRQNRKCSGLNVLKRLQLRLNQRD
jgi:hypothetical protein